MNNKQLEAVYAGLPAILPNFSPDERSEAFATLLAMDNIEPMPGHSWIEALTTAAQAARREAYGISRREFPVDPGSAKMWESMRQRDEVNEQLTHGQMPDLDDHQLAERLNDVLGRIDYESAQSFILVELRGLAPDEAASIIGTSAEEVSTRHAGVTGLLRVILSR